MDAGLSCDRTLPAWRLTLGSDQAKPLLFQGLFARERCYLSLGPHFPYQNGRYKAAPAPKSIQTVRHQNLAMLCSEARASKAQIAFAPHTPASGPEPSVLWFEVAIRRCQETARLLVWGATASWVDFVME